MQKVPVELMRKQLIAQDLQGYFVDSMAYQKFIDPAITDNGHNYQRKVFQQWLKKSVTSLLTGLNLNNAIFIAPEYFTQKNHLKLTKQECHPLFGCNNLFIKAKQNSLRQTKKNKIFVKTVVDKRQIFQELKNLLFVKQIQIEELIHNNIFDKNGIYQLIKPKQINHKDQLKYRQIVCKQLMQNSSILNSAKKYNKLINYFRKKIKKLKLLFKAKEHNFSIKKYDQSCRLEKNTIIVCLNMHGTIIGGYILCILILEELNN